MNALLYVAAAALIFVVIMVLVNGAAVSQLRTDIENLPAPADVRVGDTSLVTGLSGALVPKKYYYVTVSGVEIKTPAGTTSASSSSASTSSSTSSSASTKIHITVNPEQLPTKVDGENLLADVASRRVQFVYRPETNTLYDVARLTGTNELVVLKAFMTDAEVAAIGPPPAGAKSKKMTFVGIAENILSTR
jgi:hypothetical protein